MHRCPPLWAIFAHPLRGDYVAVGRVSLSLERELIAAAARERERRERDEASARSNCLEISTVPLRDELLPQ